MPNWEYNTVYIRLYEVKGFGLSGKKTYEWVASSPDGDELKGMCNILDYFGALGWELVSVVDEYRTGSGSTTQVDVYRAFFKRPVEAPETP